MTDNQQAAIEAAAKAMADDWNPDRDPILTAMFRDHADSALAAAEPHLRKKWAEEIIDLMPGIVDDTENYYALGVKAGINYALDLLKGAGE